MTKLTTKPKKPSAKTITVRRPNPFRTEPKRLTITERLDAIGIEAICELIEQGDSQASIAELHKVNVSDLSKWLNNEANSKRSAHAREESAEGWLDKGLATIASSLSKEGGIDAGAARAYAQECARRAAIRNPKYRDKVDVAAEVTVNTLTDEQLHAKAALLAAKLGILPKKDIPE